MFTSSTTVPQDALPELLLSVIHLNNSFMVHVSSQTQQPKLAADWACALPGASTQLLKSAIAADDASKPMAQRIAKRLNKQIFLSLDIPPDENAHLVQFKAEKAILEHLKSNST